jgi:hypothetical protein
MFKGKHSFIKNNVTGDIDSTSGNFKALNTFVTWAITKKDTLFGAEYKFAFVVWAKIRPTCTTKNTK